METKARNYRRRVRLTELVDQRPVILRDPINSKSSNSNFVGFGD